MTPLQQIENWFSAKKWSAFAFQKQTWQAYLDGKDGMLNAPTGSGKTYAVGLGILAEYLENRGSKEYEKGIQAIWITPIRALAKEIEHALSSACAELDIPWEVTKRTGDTTSAQRAKQKKKSASYFNYNTRKLAASISE